MFWRQNWANRRKKHFSCLQSQPLYQCKRLWFSSNWANIALQYLYSGNTLFISHPHKLHINIVITQHEARDNLILCCSVCFQTVPREYLTLPSLKSQEKKEPKSSQVHQTSTFLNLQYSSKKSSMVSGKIVHPWRCRPSRKITYLLSLAPGDVPGELVPGQKPESMGAEWSAWKTNHDPWFIFPNSLQFLCS